MVKRYLVCLLLVFPLLVQSAAAAPENWYVCDCEAGAEGGCTAGSDAADGLSPATAFQNYDRIQNEAVAAGHECGDTFNFCKGGVFNVAGSTEWLEASTDCTSNPTVIQSYQASWGGTLDPHIELQADGGVFSFAAASAHGATVRDIKGTCPGIGTSGTCGASSIAVNISAGVQAITLDGVELAGFQTGVNIGVSDPLGGGQLIMRNSLIRNMDDLGVVGQADTGTIIEDSTFRNNACLTAGSDCTQQRPLYLNCISPGCDPTRTLIVRRNLFDDNTLDADVSNVCGGNSVSLRGGFITFEDNTFTYTSTEPSQLCTSVRMGSITSPSCGADVNCQNCRDCVFRGNRIIGGHTALITSSWVDDGDGDPFGGVIENNVIVIPVSAGTNADDSLHTAIRSEEGSTNVDSVNLLIRNNSIIVGTSKTGVQGSDGLDLQDNTGTFTVRNNAIRMLGTGALDACFKLFSIANLTTRTDTDNNVCHRQNASASYMLLNTLRTLASVQGEAGTDEDRSFDTDPGFVGTSPGYDLNLQSPTVPVEAGDPANFAPTDKLGNARPRGIAPDIGAYEFVGNIVKTPEKQDPADFQQRAKGSR